MTLTVGNAIFTITFLFGRNKMTENIVSEKPPRLADRLSNALARAGRRLAMVRAKTWGYLLLALVIIIFLAQNWSPPTRIEILFFGPFGIPFSLSAVFCHDWPTLRLISES